MVSKLIMQDGRDFQGKGVLYVCTLSPLIPSFTAQRKARDAERKRREEVQERLDRQAAISHYEYVHHSRLASLINWPDPPYRSEEEKNERILERMERGTGRPG